MNRIFYYSFSVMHFILFSWIRLTTVRLKKSHNTSGIAALPYYPEDWPGGKDRIAEWKAKFNADGITYDVHNCWTSEEILHFFEVEKNGKVLERYRIYVNLYWRRYRLIKQLNKYETVWIQRAFIPMFPFKNALYEGLLSAIHPNVIYDFYDADYISNENLVKNTVQVAKSVTVASLFLKDKFSPINPNIAFVRYAIDTSNFLPSRKASTDQITVGWMGSPGNAKELLKISDQLQQIESEYSNLRFTFVCRDLPDLQLKRAQVQKWGDNGFDYYQWLAELDIGIVPFLTQTDRTKAKISMKSLEFMCAETAQICSPWVHSDSMIDNETFMIAEPSEWYDKIKFLLDNPEAREDFGTRSKELYQKKHSFEQVYPQLRAALLPHH